MILVNTDYIAGKELEMLGLVKGSTIQSVNMGKDIGQAFKSLVGGELLFFLLKLFFVHDGAPRLID